MTTSETPDSVTRRGVQEVLRSFARSDWTGMTLEIDGMRITVGKNGPPASAARAELQESHLPAASRQQGGFTASPVAGPPAASPPAATPPAAPPAAAPPADTTGLVEVRSPAVGAFWVAPSPGQAPFVEVGQVVAEHEQLAIVEVMKLMNPVVAGQAGEVVAVCATDAEMVEYDQVLFLIRPTDA
ncbi:acetyl-CoA carboxylase biotin carboxyl carrier protein [Pseudonocardia saturnea]